MPCSKGTIDNKRAALVLEALHIAVRNSRNVYFHIRQDDMVREVPNYAQQYLSEHPELNPPEPEPSKAKAEESQAALKKQSHPERARKRESKDPHPANGVNGAAGNSHHPAQRDRQNAWVDNTPPLTSRQSEHWNEIKKLEASIEKAMHGDWREMRTVFNAVGLVPRKPPSSQRPDSGRRNVGNGLPRHGENMNPSPGNRYGAFAV
jgi:hypothetical protein